MELIYKPDQEYLNRHASNILVSSTRKLLEEKENIIWALPGGRSIGGILEILSERDDLEWARVHFFMVDERLVPIDDRESNFRLLMEKLLYTLLRRGAITRKNMHPFKYVPEDEDRGLGLYKKELIKFGGKYDILLLSSGEDGHIGGLYPGHRSIYDYSDYYICMDDSPKPPPKRMTSTRSLLSYAHTAVLLFYGEGKKNAFDMFKNDKLTIEQCPSKIVLRIKDSYVLTDQK